MRDFVGHGIGREFHMAPQVPHYGKRGAGKRLKAGMVFTIEPMINLGHFATEVLDDDWTVVTADGSLSAQFEHTVLVTETGCEVLTARNGVLRNSEDVVQRAPPRARAPRRTSERSVQSRRPAGSTRRAFDRRTRCARSDSPSHGPSTQWPSSSR